MGSSDVGLQIRTLVHHSLISIGGFIHLSHIDKDVAKYSVVERPAPSRHEFSGERFSLSKTMKALEDMST